MANHEAARRLRTGQVRLKTFLLACLCSGLFGGALCGYALDFHRTWRVVSEVEKTGSVVHSNFHARYGLFPPARKGTWRPVVEWLLAEPDEVYIAKSGKPSARQILNMVAGLPSVRCVILSFTDCHDRDLPPLQKIRGLEEVRLFNSSVTDEGMKWLVPIAGLKSLDLSGTQITDAAIPYLEQIESLEVLTLESTGISEDALSRLSQSRPDLVIYASGNGSSPWADVDVSSLMTQELGSPE